MRRTHPRKHDHILKRQLVHVAGFNLSLIFRELMDAGLGGGKSTPPPLIQNRE